MFRTSRVGSRLIVLSRAILRPRYFRSTTSKLEVQARQRDEQNISSAAENSEDNHNPKSERAEGYKRDYGKGARREMEETVQKPQPRSFKDIRDEGEGSVAEPPADSDTEARREEARASLPTEYEFGTIGAAPQTPGTTSRNESGFTSHAPTFDEQSKLVSEAIHKRASYAPPGEIAAGERNVDKIQLEEKLHGRRTTEGHKSPDDFVPETGDVSARTADDIANVGSHQDPTINPLTGGQTDASANRPVTRMDEDPYPH